jgi:hypothetical protein
MRRLIFGLFIVVSSLVSAFSLAYTGADVDMANSLALSGIIVDQSANPTKYRLDDTITRQEVIGMTLKFQGILLPTNYTCKGYFTDAIF